MPRGLSGWQRPAPGDPDGTPDGPEATPGGALVVQHKNGPEWWIGALSASALGGSPKLPWARGYPECLAGRGPLAVRACCHAGDGQTHTHTHTSQHTLEHAHTHARARTHTHRRCTAPKPVSWGHPPTHTHTPPLFLSHFSLTLTLSFSLSALSTLSTLSTLFLSIALIHSPLSSLILL